MGGTVFTTLELVLGTLPGVRFTREMDAATGYDELVVAEAAAAAEEDRHPPPQKARQG